MTKPFFNNIHLRSFVTALLTGTLREQGFWQKVIIWLVKLFVLVFSGWYLYVHVIQNAKFNEIFTISKSLLENPLSIWLLVGCIVMTIINWSIETLKWRYLLKRFAKISFIRAFAAIMSGNAISLWTPNRVGEYIGRIIFLDPDVRGKSVFATLAGGISQLVVTLIMGALGFVFYEKMSNIPSLIQLVTGIAGLLFIGLLLFFYFNIRVVRGWFPVRKWTKSIRRYLLVYRQYKRHELETVLLYSLSRYIVFSIQFYILLIFFGVNIPFIQSMMLIFVMFLVQTISPTTGLTELLVRGGTTLFLFQGFTNNTSAVLFASYGIWIINLLVPALIGAVIFGFARINKRLRKA